MNALPARVEVLVVGFGPVGATIACLLGQYAVSTLVVDKATDILQMPRAIALDNEALRILQGAGLEESAFARRAIPLVRMKSPYAGEFARVNTAGSRDGHPKLVTFYQPDLERALRARAAAHAAVSVATGVELLEFQDGTEGVHACLRLADGTTAEVHARYLVGADGANSQIRAAIGEDFRGRTYEEDWLIVDAERCEQSLDHIEFVCDPRRPVPHMPAPDGRERWEFMLHPGETREHMEQDATIRELLAPWGPVDGMRIARKAVYRFHARSCSRFSKGHVFLVGDAAHVTPPFVGQGLVAGLRDAANLCWKLAWVVQGRASPAILASYDNERRPHAKAMIDFARFMGHLIMPRSAFKARLVHGLMRALRLLPPLRALFDDLRIKPENRFRRGLFAASGRASARLAGRWLPQGLVRSSRDGRIHLSDDVLGDGLVVLGLGADPARHLDAAARAAWEAAGGCVVRIDARGGCGDGSGTHEDLSDALVPGLAPTGSAIVVRPDRTIMHAGPVHETARLVRESLALLAATPSTLPEA